MVCYDTNGTTGADVLGTSDIVIGAIIAVMLAFLASFLQGRRNQNDFVLGEIKEEEWLSSTNSTCTNDEEGRVVFDGKSWREVSDPENYILYKGKLRERDRKRKEAKQTEKFRTF